MWGLWGGAGDEGDFPCGGEWTTYYADAELQNGTLEGCNFINQCHPNKFNL